MSKKRKAGREEEARKTVDREPLTFEVVSISAEERCGWSQRSGWAIPSWAIEADLQLEINAANSPEEQEHYEELRLKPALAELESIPQGRMFAEHAAQRAVLCFNTLLVCQ